MEILRTENLKKIYKTLSGEIRALDGVSLSVEEALPEAARLPF